MRAGQMHSRNLACPVEDGGGVVAAHFLDVALGVRPQRVHQIREGHAVPDEEHRDVVACTAPNPTCSGGLAAVG